MEAILLIVPTRKLDCGSLRALLSGKAASTVGSMSKMYASRLIQSFYSFCLSIVRVGYAYFGLYAKSSYVISVECVEFDKFHPKLVLPLFIEAFAYELLVRVHAVIYF